MKKYVLFLALGFAALANAQTGSWYVGGSGGFNSNKPEGGDAFTIWNFSPEVGTFFTDNVQVGVAFNITGTSSDADGSGFGVTPYTRYFFAPGQAFRPFVGASLPISTFKYDDTTIGVVEVKDNEFGVNINAGFGYALSPRWTVVGNIGVLGFASNSRKIGNADAVKSTNFGLNLNTLSNPFNVGLYYTFKQ